MTPEKIKRVMELVRHYGEKCGEAEANRGYRDSIYGEAEQVFAEIEAELKGGGTE